jgi:subtilase family serine protease
LNGTGLFNVTHVFNKTGNFAVRVNVTDLFSNWNGYTKRVIVAASPRPDVRIDDISFSKDPTQGSDMTITVNVTNRGSANATGVLLTFYIEHDDGTETLIGTSSALTNNTGANGIPVTGKDQVNFTWKPDHKGSYSIKVNCTSTNQLEVHDMTDVVTVKENPTTRVFLWVGVAAVVILVPLALYFRGRLSKREKKGPRREEKK